MQFVNSADNGATEAPEPATPTNEETPQSAAVSENEEAQMPTQESENEEKAEGEKEALKEKRTKEEQITETKAFSQALNRMSEKRFAKLSEELEGGLLSDNPAVAEAMRIIGDNALKEDLTSIKAAYPQVLAKDPRELGEVFVALMATGKVDAVVAYEAQIAADARKQALAAPSPGGIGTGDADGSPYVSRETARSFTKNDYASDPALMQRVREAMTKWK